MTTPSTTEVEARSYELDPYGHLNNAVYVNWLEHGRLCFLRDRGLDYDSVPREFLVWIVVVQQDIAYKAQVRLGDRLAIASRVARFGDASFTFDQSIAYLDGRAAALAKVTMCCINAQGKAVRMPEALRRRLDT
ncbi:MAG: acyl-CoA thioesterase [Planctomycetota bacterium]